MRGITIAAVLAVQQVIASNVFRKCQEPEVQQNFDLDSYLSTWYEYKRDKDCTYESGICDTATYSLNDDGTIRVRNNDYYDSKSKWGGGTGKAFIVNPEDHDGYLKVKFVPFVPAGDYKILETDYDGYAVIYTCMGLGGIFNIEYVWILTRDPNPSAEIIEKAMNVLSTKIPKYDVSALQLTPQGDGALASGASCPYESQPNSNGSVFSEYLLQ